jgi:hypothetical protein
MGYLSFYELISVFLTFGTLIVIYFTLLELKNQRETIYKPDIVLKSSGRFYIYNEQNGRFAYLPSLWVSEEITKSKIFSKNTSLQENEKLKMPDQETFQELSNDPDRNKIGIPLFNIGKGAAKNIEIKWEFDQDKHRQDIKDKNELKNLWKKFEFSGTFIPSQDISQDSYFSRKIDYITPSITGSVDETIEQVYLPYDFQMLFNKIITIEMEDDDYFDIPNLLKLNISYDDLANQRHCKKFIFNFEQGYGSWSPKFKGIQKCVICHMEIKYQINEIS